ncbi:unnamed protein product [Mytilus coruscus]|uniref:Uncharacterized protein n=1 Tax=Mytilus coruscus TaxID=42192 RepID=A0A6J8CUZ1_MYTCO|nr:unnamed protein product [Mytilus coruscus]
MNTDSPTSLEESPDVSQQDIFRAVKQQIKFQQQPFREPYPGWYAGFPLYSNMPSTSGSQPKFQQGAYYGCGSNQHLRNRCPFKAKLLKSQDLLIRGLIIESTVDKPLVVNSLAISVQNNGNKKFNFRYTSCQLTSMEDTFVKFEDIIVTITACNRVRQKRTSKGCSEIYDIAELSNDLDSQLGFIPDLLAYSKSDNIVNKYYFGFLQWKKNLSQVKGKFVFIQQKPLSYTRMREIFIDAISPFVPDIKSYGLHSLRSCGATAAARFGVQIDFLNVMDVGSRTLQEWLCERRFIRTLLWRAYSVVYIILDICTSIGYNWIFGTSIGYTWIFGTSIGYTIIGNIGLYIDGWFIPGEQQ